MLEIKVVYAHDFGEISLSVLGLYYVSVILFGCVFYILERRLYQGTLVFPKVSVWLAVLLAFAIMLFLAYYEYGNSDVRSAVEVLARFAYAGQDIYKEVHPISGEAGHPYFPYWIKSILFWKWSFWGLLGSIWLSFGIDFA